jgi:alkylation response protein AidB-like acyl-CoA dehydrogenase
MTAYAAGSNMSTPHSISVDCAAVTEKIRIVAADFAQQRHERQRRRHLDAADFIRLQEAGFLRTGVPVEQGGLLESVAHSTRAVAEMLRVLAQGDSSVALVASMHPAVLYVARWPVQPEAPPPYTQAWEEQRQYVFQSALDGHWWGTITSEPASGGDVLKTRALARCAATEGEYRLSGQKHFGSGSGITSFMVTTAVPEGESEPDWFFLDMRGVPWDGSAGVKLVAEWDGHGMTATQSHGMQFDDFPATRVAHPGVLRRAMVTGEDGVNVGFIPCIFTAVIVGIVEVAVETARARLEQRRESLNAYEQVEWVRVQQEAWLIQQAYEGMLRATEEQNGRGALWGKSAVAELAESAMTRLCRVMGGGSYARHSPFGFWFEDVRALGFLRPPWALTYAIFQTLGWKAEE